MQQQKSINRVLISVYDKTGILEIANFLNKKNIEIISTTGTYTFLIKKGLKVTKISDFTKFPEIMNGRIKTLHHKIYGAILARHHLDDDVINKFNINTIDMIIINLYPINTESITQKNLFQKNIINNIDIGGPSIIRAAAKNYENVVVIVNNYDYLPIINEMNNNKNIISLKTKLKLAATAFKHITKYDEKITQHFYNQLSIESTNINIKQTPKFPKQINLMNKIFIKEKNLSYGENNHQHAALYIKKQNNKNITTKKIKKIQGTELSYNNINDINTALECIQTFSQPTCLIIKHSNPCGVASSTSINEAYKKAYQADPTSAFGGTITFNKILDPNTAYNIINQQFTAIIIAPCIDKNAIDILSHKKNIKIITYDNEPIMIPNIDIKLIYNEGLIIQEHDKKQIDLQSINVMTKRKPNNKEINDAIFCWKIIKHIKSNAIIYAHNYQTIGIGAGQMSRIFAVKIATIKAKETGFNINGATMASDAFFPFPDSIETAAEAGITCIIQPGGSIRDQEVINTANNNNIAMLFTNTRHFKH